MHVQTRFIETLNNEQNRHSNFITNIGSRVQDRHCTIIMKIKRLCTFNNVLTFKVIADIMKFYKKD